MSKEIEKISLTKIPVERMELLKIMGIVVHDGEKTYYHLPQYFEEFHPGYYIQRKFDELPADVKEMFDTIKNHQTPV